MSKHGIEGWLVDDPPPAVLITVADLKAFAAGFGCVVEQVYENVGSVGYVGYVRVTVMVLTRKDSVDNVLRLLNEEAAHRKMVGCTVRFVPFGTHLYRDGQP